MERISNKVYESRQWYHPFCHRSDQPISNDQTWKAAGQIMQNQYPRTRPKEKTLKSLWINGIGTRRIGDRRRGAR
jgi:hypothetical protein